MLRAFTFPSKLTLSVPTFTSWGGFWTIIISRYLRVHVLMLSCFNVIVLLISWSRILEASSLLYGRKLGHGWFLTIEVFVALNNPLVFGELFASNMYNFLNLWQIICIRMYEIIRSLLILDLCSFLDKWSCLGIYLLKVSHANPNCSAWRAVAEQ
jgi:hypothetical protein